ncbi:unnamed protein product [Prorocentrum cordatum]|uniref:Uncharacterized protein n=1 Tax=Prorocentrum cordatum TaxID=2364126 RepID=A0ABN9XCX2_9DINO|nr:unnamed protein product [Polarella glacialis]
MLAAASVGRRRRELRHGRPLASRRLWERQRAVGKRRQRRAGGGRESPALPPRGVSAPPPPCPRAESRGERWGRIRRRRRRTRTARRPYHQSPACESTSRVALAVNSRPALAQRQQSRRPQTGGRADPDTHTHTHTHTQHNKKTPGLVKRARASGPSVGGGPTRRSSKREQKQELSEVHANLIS